MSKVPTIRFILLNFIAAVVWATVFCTGGYLLGTMLESVIAEVERYEAFVLVAIVLAGVIALFVHRYLARRRRDVDRLAAGQEGQPVRSEAEQTERQRDA